VRPRAAAPIAAAARAALRRARAPGPPGHSPRAAAPLPRRPARAGISRDSLHKRRATGGRKKAWRKKKKYELGRQPANTKLSSNVAVRTVRTRGGNTKFRALRLDHGNYSWGSEVRPPRLGREGRWRAAMCVRQREGRRGQSWAQGCEAQWQVRGSAGAAGACLDLQQRAGRQLAEAEAVGGGSDSAN
jgi:hypothetical protein